MANIAQLLAAQLATPGRALYRQFADGAWRDYTAVELASAAARWQAAFRREGFAAGDRIAIGLRNGITWVALGGGVKFEGDLAACYRANLRSRIASRVLWRVAEAPYANEHDVYEAALRVAWPERFAVDRTIRVDVSAIRSPVKSLDFVTLRVKDAVCDRFRADTGRRPDVDTRAPAVRIHAFLDARSATFYLDTSGEPLWKRGWRGDTGEAPLR